MRDAEIARRLAAVRRDFKNIPLVCAESLSVENKRGQVVQMVPQPAQLRLFGRVMRAIAENRPLRLLFLKARQVMVSSAFEAFVFLVLAFQRGQKARVVAHLGDSAELIYRYFQIFQRHYVPFRGLIGAAGVVSDADGFMAFDNGSEVRVSTAGTGDTGRGGSNRLVHFSEIPFYKHAELLMAGLMNTVPDEPGTFVLGEGTANGAAGYFYELWQDSGDWEKEFFAWFEHPEYTRKIEGDVRRFQDSLTHAEMELMRLHRCTLEQIAWRRYKIRTALKNSEKTFHQEYPSTPEEAFLHSGRPRFDLISIGFMPRRAADLRCELVELDDGRVRRQENTEGSVHIFQAPVDGARYIAGVDLAEGKDVSAVGGKTQPGKSDPDYSVLQLLNARSGEQVAMMRGRIQPGEFAKMTRLLAKLYGWFFVVPEANGTGLAYLEKLQDLNYPMGKVYHRKPGPAEILTSGNDELLQTLGFKTSAVTRPQLISKLDDAIRDGAVLVHDPLTLGELRTFVIKANGKAEAADGHHDDCAIALALAYEGLDSMPPERAVQVVWAPASKGSRVYRYGEAGKEDRRKRR